MNQSVLPKYLNPPMPEGIPLPLLPSFRCLGKDCLSQALSLYPWKLIHSFLPASLIYTAGKGPAPELS